MQHINKKLFLGFQLQLIQEVLLMLSIIHRQKIWLCRDLLKALQHIVPLQYELSETSDYSPMEFLTTVLR